MTDNAPGDGGPVPDSPERGWRLADLADLHAGCLDPEATVRLQAQVLDDPLAQQTLAALDRTVDDLLHMPTVAMPPDVVARLDAALSAEFQARERGRPPVLAPGAHPLVPGPVQAAPASVDFAARAHQQALANSGPPAPGGVLPGSQRPAVTPAASGPAVMPGSQRPGVPRPLAVPPVLPGAAPVNLAARRRRRFGGYLAAAAAVAAGAVAVPLMINAAGGTSGNPEPAPGTVVTGSPNTVPLASIKDLRSLKLEASSMPPEQFQACLAANGVDSKQVIGATVDQYHGERVVVIGVQRADGTQYRLVLEPSCGKNEASGLITSLPAAP